MSANASDTNGSSIVDWKYIQAVQYERDLKEIWYNPLISYISKTSK